VADGEDITNKIPRIQGGLKGLGGKSASSPDVPESQGFQAFVGSENQRIEASAQGLVNHAGQGLVNHADG
jgi:hypothetical protein